MKKLRVTRREFCTLALSAGFSGGAAIREKTEKVPKRTLQVAIVGIDRETSMLSYWFAHNLKSLKELDISLLAICENDPETLGWKRGGARFAYTDFRKLLREQSGKIDAVFVSSLFLESVSCVFACLKRGIPVYCNLPFSPDVESGKRMIKCARDSGALLYCGPLAYGDERKLIEFSRERLCGGEKLLGDCIRICARSYIRTMSELDNSSSLPQSAATEIFKNSLGFRVMLRQCVDVLHLYPRFPRSVMGFQTSFGKLVSGADLAVFQYDDNGKNIVSEMSLCNGMEALKDRFTVSYFGEFGAAHISCIPENSAIEMELFAGESRGNSEKTSAYRKRWYQAIRKPLGVLGKGIDIAGRHLSSRSIGWRCETEEEYRELAAKTADFKGERNLWRFPKSLIDYTSENRVWGLEDFFLQVSSLCKNCDSAIEVYRAQVMVYGVEQSLKTGKPFYFTPDMFNA